MFRKASVNVKYHLFKIFCMNLYGTLFWGPSREKVTSFLHFVAQIPKDITGSSLCIRDIYF